MARYVKRSVFFKVCAIKKAPFGAHRMRERETLFKKGHFLNRNAGTGF
jgi:hypothetical protein